MKASELRIGNWFIDRGGNHRMVEADDIVKVEMFSDAYQPISLTPGWLKQLGFIDANIGTGDYVILSSAMPYVVRKDEEFVLAIILLGDNALTLNQSVKHVHQLQNLYFALTGKEIFQGEGLTHPIVD